MESGARYAPYIRGRRNKVAVASYEDRMQQWAKWPRVAWLTPDVARIFSERMLRLFVVAVFALALAGCDKCSMPVWRHDTPAAPQSCHDDVPAQQ
jgi:hypothetical protein